MAALVDYYKGDATEALNVYRSPYKGPFDTVEELVWAFGGHSLREIGKFGDNRLKMYLGYEGALIRCIEAGSVVMLEVSGCFHLWYVGQKEVL